MCAFAIVARSGANYMGVPKTDIEDADGIAEAVKDRLEKELGCGYCVIHVEPAGQGSLEQERTNA